ncbi:MAG: universal stress protein [Lentisphaerae bacterium]|nr:universal stress protein [Lentisphaerota bacterium]
MIKNILFGIDGSVFGDTARDYAIDLALRLNAQLEAVHVVDSRMMDFPLIAPQSGVMSWNPGLLNGLQESLRERGETLLRETADRGQSAGISMVTALEFGHPAQVLAEVQNRTELLVLGRQGEHAKSAPDITGSTMERVIRRAIRPCLVTPASFQPISRILVGVDGSVTGAKALHEAVELANALNIPLIILSVAGRESDRPAADKNVLEAHSLARAHDCAAASLTAIGAPATGIIDQAVQTGSSLIVMGSHGHGWIYERLIGSTAAHVASLAPMPVLLVR